MERNRQARLPWAIALLIVVFASVIALAAGRIIGSATHRSSYDYKAVKLSNNIGLDVVNDGFVYYDGSYIIIWGKASKVKCLRSCSCCIIGIILGFNRVFRSARSSISPVDARNTTGIIAHRYGQLCAATG